MLDTAKARRKRILTTEIRTTKIAHSFTNTKVKNEDVRQFLDIHTILFDRVAQQRLQWFGKVERIRKLINQKQCTASKIPEEKI